MQLCILVYSYYCNTLLINLYTTCMFKSAYTDMYKGTCMYSIVYMQYNSRNVSLCSIGWLQMGQSMVGSLWLSAMLWLLSLLLVCRSLWLSCQITLPEYLLSMMWVVVGDFKNSMWYARVCACVNVWPAWVHVCVCVCVCACVHVCVPECLLHPIACRSSLVPSMKRIQLVPTREGNSTMERYIFSQTYCIISIVCVYSAQRSSIHAWPSREACALHSMHLLHITVRQWCCGSGQTSESVLTHSW